MEPTPVAASSEPGPLALVLIVLAFPIVFAAFWSLVCLLLGQLGGWSGLARRFATEQEQPGGADAPMGAMLGLVSYRGGTLQVGFAPDGLDLRVMVFFRPGHPPLRIPWDQVTVEGESKAFWVSWVRLRLGGGPTLRIPADLWARSGRG